MKNPRIHAPSCKHCTCTGPSHSRYGTRRCGMVREDCMGNNYTCGCPGFEVMTQADFDAQARKYGHEPNVRVISAEGHYVLIHEQNEALAENEREAASLRDTGSFSSWNPPRQDTAGPWILAGLALVAAAILVVKLCG